MRDPAAGAVWAGRHRELLRGEDVVRLRVGQRVVGEAQWGHRRVGLGGEGELVGGEHVVGLACKRSIRVHGTDDIVAAVSAVDDARRIIAAWQSEGVDGVEPLVHPEFVGEVGPDTSVEPDTYVGRAGMRRYFAAWDDTIEGLRLELIGLEEAGPGVALTHLRISGRGLGSGVPVSFDAWAVMGFRDGLLVRTEAAADRDTALRVAQGAGG